MTVSRSSLWPDYRTVWRWHFFAGLFCLPFVAFLCLTGTLYLFKPQIERWIDWRYDHLLMAGPISTPAQEVDAALLAVPGSHFLAYELPSARHSAARVIVDRSGVAIRVYVDPSSRAVLKQVAEEDRFERIILKLHGQLLLGNIGSAIMEMVASWTIVLVFTGLILWWPRGKCRVAGVLYPRLTAGDRMRWRDLHAVSGVWVSLFLTLFLLSGLPWSFVWGHALSRVETRFSRLTTIQDWEIGAVPARAIIAGQAPTQPGMNAMPGMDMTPTTASQSIVPDGLNNVVGTAMRLGYPAPVLITAPSGNETAWRVRSDTQNRPERISALVDRAGTIRSVRHFADNGIVDRMIAYGVAAHEGQLFGIANQVLNLLVACGLLTMSVAAIVIWLCRKPPGRLGAPAALPDGRIGVGAVMALILLGLLLPELGGSLLVLCLVTMIARRVGRA
ncbi:hypothetical protein AD929_08165 [Gluconobacter potus]|uniref:PepSY domain-containing protein n=1 Tax=Gluconobacter potus TaxID=2724927 RepID=A0A149QV05_9PROT|nr:PepSY domain-containing protein [Gluconobacter potus]KXV01132.1 hypothetical protein AD929_08165 [Gluconobacter potus]